MNEDKKKAVGEAMRNLQQAVFENSLALTLQYEDELTSLMGEEFSMGFLADITEKNSDKGIDLIDVYLSKVLEETNGGEK